VRVLSRQETGRLSVRTVAGPRPGDLLGHIPQPDVVAWVHHGAGLAGWGEAVRVSLPAGEDRFTAGEKWLRSVFDAADIDDQVRLRGSGPVAFGSFTFDASSDEIRADRPARIRARPRRPRPGLAHGVLDRGDDPPRPPRPGGTHPPRPPLGGTAPQTPLPAPLPRPRSAAGGRGACRASWEEAVAEAVAAIKAGSLRKVVLARDLFATAAEPIDARVLLRRLAARYPDCFTFACDGMVGATPELLVRRAGRQVSALVLGGTAPRGGDPAQDEALGSELLASAKNNEEHAYAVASIRDALGPLCDALEVEARPGLLKFPNLQHLGTQVRGTLADTETEVSARPGGGGAPARRGLRHPDRRRA
jgi:menaquinone-specific isochorismate synthase